MPASLHQFLLLLHLLGAMVWIGGMFFAYFCLRPAANETLPPPGRLPLWVAAFRRFLRYAAVAVALILATGFGLLSRTGAGAAPPGWQAMQWLGLLMALVFGVVYLVLYPRLRRQVAAASWPAAARSLNTIRQLVAVNLVLGLVVVGAAVSAR